MTVDDWYWSFQFLSVVIAVLAVLALAVTTLIGRRINKRDTTEVLALKTELSKQQELTARAEIELAQIRRNALPRSVTFDESAFQKELEGAPQSTVEIWYPPGDNEAYDLGFRIAGALHLAGWRPSHLPVPIPSTARQSDLPNRSPESLAALPPLARVGAQSTDISLFGRTMPFGPLAKALTRAMPGRQVASAPDASMPEGTIRIVVGAK